MSILVVAEHDNAELKSATLVTIAAAQAIGGDIDVLVVGSGSDAVAQAATALGIDRAAQTGVRVLFAGKSPGAVRQTEGRSDRLREDARIQPFLQVFSARVTQPPIF